MILLNLSGREEKAADLFCPNCDLRMSAHSDAGACPKSKLSRRYFLGALGTVAAGVAVSQFMQSEAVAAKVLENFVVDAAEGESETIVAVAAPKIWRHVSLAMNFDLNETEQAILHEYAERRSTKLSLKQEDSGMPVDWDTMGYRYDKGRQAPE